ncbi:MAG: glycosyltransferase [Candidatus Aminicenantes bacterium]|nr:glycosyltransferase [Candidatus Aminicenantes bacterium]
MVRPRNKKGWRLGCWCDKIEAIRLMRIGIDAHAAERDGSGNCTYIRNLIQSLIRLDGRNQYILYAINSQHPFYQTLQTKKQVQIKQPPFQVLKNPLLRIPLWLGFQTFKDKLDILHVQYIAPPFYKGQLVTTIHDLGFLHVPETFSMWEAFRSKILIRITARRSDKIITGSQYSKQDIIRSYCIPHSQVKVIPLGISSHSAPPTNSSETQKILRKYRIQSLYLLSVGRLNPRKNLSALVKAFSLLKEKINLPHKLVITGSQDFNSQKVIRTIKKTPYSRDVLFTGLVSDQELWGLYKNADIFVYPSLFEGVGLPVLEAMSLGLPVVTSNSSSLKETAGDAAILINPSDPQEISQAIERLITDPALKNTYAEKGKQHSNKFSWSSTARQTLKTYEKTAALYESC